MCNRGQFLPYCYSNPYGFLIWEMCVCLYCYLARMSPEFKIPNREQLYEFLLFIWHNTTILRKLWFVFLYPYFTFFCVGISYISRVQESLARQTNTTPLDFRIYSKSSKSFADSLFIEGIKSRILYWRTACLASDESPHGVLSCNWLAFMEYSLSLFVFLGKKYS